MKVVPIYNNVLISKIKEEDKKIGSLYAPDTVNSKPLLKGKVLEVGPGQYEHGVFVLPNSAIIKDAIVYVHSSNAMHFNTTGDEEVYIVQAESIIAVEQ